MKEMFRITDDVGITFLLVVGGLILLLLCLALLCLTSISKKLFLYVRAQYPAVPGGAAAGVVGFILLLALSWGVGLVTRSFNLFGFPWIFATIVIGGTLLFAAGLLLWGFKFGLYLVAVAFFASLEAFFLIVIVNTNFDASALIHRSMKIAQKNNAPLYLGRMRLTWFDAIDSMSGEQRLFWGLLRPQNIRQYNEIPGENGAVYFAESGGYLNLPRYDKMLIVRGQYFLGGDTWYQCPPTWLNAAGECVPTNQR